MLDTKQAAKLAAVATGLGLLASMIPLIVMSFQDYSRVGLSMLFPLFMMVLGAAAFPLFFFLIYKSAPLLLVPKSARRAALAAAVGTGLSGALTIYSFIRALAFVLDNARTVTQRMDHPLMWFWQAILTPAIGLLPAVVVPLFFVTLYRCPSGGQPLPGNVRKAAAYAAASCLLGAAMWVSDGIHMQATMRHQSRLSQLDLALATSLLYDLSLAVFFVIWYTRVPTVQSSQRFKIGE